MHLDPDLAARITATPSTWLVTGAAGFIGSNLVETLLNAIFDRSGLKASRWRSLTDDEKIELCDLFNVVPV